MHQLDFFIHDTLNQRAFKIEDISVYDSSIPYKNGLIEVIPPGFSNPFVFNVKKSFELVLNANLLHLNTSSQKYALNLPDGLYKIKYSVDPNKDVNIEYWYFRVTLLESSYLKVLNSLKDKNCSLGNIIYSKREEELFSLKEYILAAKYRAEDLLDCEGALKMYEEITTLLNDFEKCH